MTQFLKLTFPMTIPAANASAIYLPTTRSMASSAQYLSNGATVTYTWGMNTQSEFVFYPDAYESYPNGQGCGLYFDVPAVTKRVVNDSTRMSWSRTLPTQQPGSSNYWYWSGKTTTVVNKDLVRGTNFTTTYTYGGYPIPLQPNSYGIASSQAATELTEATRIRLLIRLGRISI